MSDAPRQDPADVWEAAPPGRGLTRAELYDGARRCGLSSAGLWAAIEEATAAGYLRADGDGLLWRADLARCKGRPVLPEPAAVVAAEPTGNPGGFVSRWGWVWCRRVGHFVAQDAHRRRGCGCGEGAI